MNSSELPSGSGDGKQSGGVPEDPSQSNGAAWAEALQLQELQHRVKNTLHLVGTLLRRAEREVSDRDAKQKIREVASKVAAIGALERLMYESACTDQIEVLALTEAVVQQGLALSPRETECDVSGKPVRIRAQAATSLALIINELLMNSIKHARTGDHPLRIGVNLRQAGDLLELTILDSGSTSENQKVSDAGSGVDLVRGLLQQLGGSLGIEQTSGTRCIVRLPVASIS